MKINWYWRAQHSSAYTWSTYNQRSKSIY